jgi:DNA modification methylase
MELSTNKIICGDALQVLQTLPDESVNMVMTSPPYWALRDYGHPLQLGIEPTFQEYINKLCGIFDEVKRVLRNDGTCWVNIGDSYVGSGDGLEKSLLQIPFRFSIEMANRGWILRNTIIWYKRNCMPSSVTDRFTVDFEYLFFFAKNKKYWFEQQFDKSVYPESYEGRRQRNAGTMAKFDRENYAMTGSIQENGKLKSGQKYPNRNKRCVWDITTRGYKESHFATYPEELCVTPIKAGCPEFICDKCGKTKKKIYKTEKIKCPPIGGIKHPGNNTNIQYTGNTEHNEIVGFEYSDCGCNAGFHPGVVLDPFSGTGTTCLVARKLGRKYIGIELNPSYVNISEKRIHNEAGLL